MVQHDSTQTHTIPHGLDGGLSEDSNETITAEEHIASIRANTSFASDASRIEARHPKLYHLICSLLALGMAPQSIATAANMDCRSVLAIRARADTQGVIPTFREAYMTKLRDLLTVGGDELLTRFQAGKVTALDLKLLCDQHELLSGNATVIVRTIEDPEITALRSEHQQQLARRLEQAQTALSDRVRLDGALTVQHMPLASLEGIELTGSNAIGMGDESNEKAGLDASKPAAKSPKRRTAKPPVITLEPLPQADRSPSDAV